MRGFLAKQGFRAIFGDSMSGDVPSGVETILTIILLLVIGAVLFAIVGVIIQFLYGRIKRRK